METAEDDFWDMGSKNDLSSLPGLGKGGSQVGFGRRSVSGSNNGNISTEKLNDDFHSSIADILGDDAENFNIGEVVNESDEEVETLPLDDDVNDKTKIHPAPAPEPISEVTISTSQNQDGVEDVDDIDDILGLDNGVGNGTNEKASSNNRVADITETISKSNGNFLAGDFGKVEEDNVSISKFSEESVESIKDEGNEIGKVERDNIDNVPSLDKNPSPPSSPSPDEIEKANDNYVDDPFGFPPVDSDSPKQQSKNVDSGATYGISSSNKKSEEEEKEEEDALSSFKTTRRSNFHLDSSFHKESNIGSPTQEKQKTDIEKHFKNQEVHFGEAEVEGLKKSAPGPDASENNPILKKPVAVPSVSNTVDSVNSSILKEESEKLEKRRRRHSTKVKDDTEDKTFKEFSYPIGKSSENEGKDQGEGPIISAEEFEQMKVQLQKEIEKERKKARKLDKKLQKTKELLKTTVEDKEVLAKKSEKLEKKLKKSKDRQRKQEKDINMEMSKLTNVLHEWNSLSTSLKVLKKRADMPEAARNYLKSHTGGTFTKAPRFMKLPPNERKSFRSEPLKAVTMNPPKQLKPISCRGEGGEDSSNIGVGDLHESKKAVQQQQRQEPRGPFRKLNPMHDFGASKDRYLPFRNSIPSSILKEESGIKSKVTSSSCSLSVSGQGCTSINLGRPKLPSTSYQEKNREYNGYVRKASNVAVNTILGESHFSSSTSTGESHVPSNTNTMITKLH
eukprot:Nk52_evm86s2118 gene=Nk52_evmTU86s2118